MSSVVGLLNENVTEAIKSFYKLRKAYLALEGILENERKYLKERSTSSVNSTSSNKSTRPGSVQSKSGGSTLKGSRPPTSTGESAAASSSIKQEQGAEKTREVKDTVLNSKKISKDDDEDFEFVDAVENKSGSATPGEYMGHLNMPIGEGKSIAVDNAQTTTKLESAPGQSSIDGKSSNSVSDTTGSLEQLRLKELVIEDPITDISQISDHPIDGFILAGSNFCFGMLQLLLSFVPPTFAMLLKIVGFKGDRDRGMQMLWRATSFQDIHGAISGVVLMGYLNGFGSLCDMIPSTGEGSYPKERCTALLKRMRQQYPKSHLWLLEESRMLAADKELEKAVEFIEKAGESPLKQLEALGWFERSLNNMYMHNYEATAVAFQKCITLNNWSHALYYYICGASYVELYRRSKIADPAAAKVHADKAKEFFAQVTPHIGKKKFMGRQLPFDIFISRKLQKWEARAKEWNCDLIDAVGVSPVEEMIFFWNGFKRMRNDHLQTSLDNLAWSESSANPHWDKEGLDEKSILNILRATTLRNMGRTTEAKALLEKEIIPVDRTLFKGPLKDSWTAPCARYEMAANLWHEADIDGNPEQSPELLNKCRDWLAEVTSWDAFDLDARSVQGNLIYILGDFLDHVKSYTLLC